MRMISLAMWLLLTGAIGCSTSEPSDLNPMAAQVATRRPPTIPITMLVAQRTTTPIPGFNGKLMLTIDDITRAQAMVMVTSTGPKTHVGPVSLRAGDQLEYQYEGMTYQLQLLSLTNWLIGNDVAEIRVETVQKSTPSEVENISFLLQLIMELEGSVFFRNGREQTPEEFVAELRIKLDAASGSLTAEEFIREIAARRPPSGDPLRLRRPDGTTEDVGRYLRRLIGLPLRE